MKKFFRIKPDIYAPVGVISEPHLRDPNDTFITGTRLCQQPASALVFNSTFDTHSPPRGFEGMTIPLWSYDFVALLLNIDVNNFDLYEAVIGNNAGMQWDNYYAVNVIGIMDAANMTKSHVTSITPTPNNVPLSRFHHLVIDAHKVDGVDLFRLAESPSTLIVSDHITQALANNARPGGWGITAFPIELA